MQQTTEEIKKLLLSEGRPTGGLPGFDAYPTLKKLLEEVELPLIPVLTKMHDRGILLDTQELKRVGEDIALELAASEAKLSAETGGGINLNSPSQLGQFLAETLLIPLPKTKTGKYATNEKVLTQFASKYPFISQLVAYRGLAKLKSTYVESLLQKVDSKGRIHTSYNQIGADTGRLSSTNPNLQNIPVSSPLGLAIKSCFVATPGFSLVSFDYSQQELRILAHLSGEEALIQAFRENRDVHTDTASRIFGTPYESITKEQRKIAKTINFGIIYGMGTFGLSNSLRISLAEADHFIGEFYKSYPAIKTYYEHYLKDGQKKGYVETILGRRRFVADTNDRVLMNFPIQGSAADLMKKAMVDIDRMILQKYPEIYLILQIHDDLVFEIPDQDTKGETIDAIRDVLCNAWPLKVPLAVDVKMGTKWGDLSSV